MTAWALVLASASVALPGLWRAGREAWRRARGQPVDG